MDSKNRALYVLAVCVVANTGDGVLIDNDFAPVLSDLLKVLINIGDPNGIDGASDGLIWADDAPINTVPGAGESCNIFCAMGNAFSGNLPLRGIISVTMALRKLLITSASLVSGMTLCAEPA